jgi:hypothetical protein
MGMPRYEPIDAGVSVKASLSDLAAFCWTSNTVVADFVIPDDAKQLLRVKFDGQNIVRILDEMPLSTEEDGRVEGLVAEHFAYRVHGSTFFDSQSQAWKVAAGEVAHYRFVTGWACMDVVSSSRPTFGTVER